MARQKPADAAKAKAAKQKKIVIGLCVFLACAVAYAAHTMMALNSGSGAKPVAADPNAAPVAAPVTGAPVATPVAAPTLAGSPLAAAAAPAATDTSGLIAAVKPVADQGQLESFSRFESKDPFAGPSGGSGTSGTGTTGSTGGTGGTGTPTTPTVPPAPPTPPAPAPTSAVISVNNVPESVASGANFPVANPSASANGLFQLRSLTATTATVVIVGGSYANGSPSLTLKVNKPVTLVNTADGTRYTLLLSPQGTATSAAPASGGSTAAPVAPVTPVAPAVPVVPTAPGG
jgi:hypothetical protein